MKRSMSRRLKGLAAIALAAVGIAILGHAAYATGGSRNVPAVKAGTVSLAADAAAPAEMNTKVITASDQMLQTLNQVG